MQIKNLSLKSLIRKSVWSFSPKSEKESSDAIVKNFWLHWFPAQVSLRSFSWKYSYWLGTITAVLFFQLCLTGIILMFLYIPSTEKAYQSIKDLEYVVSFGWFIRRLHRFSAHGMVIMAFLHMVRVFFTGAYKKGTAAESNRPLNWIVGLVLFLLTLFLSFTGYLLPWDQLAFWAVTVGANIGRSVPVIGEWIYFVLVGGTGIGQNTLLRFYVLHCFFLPAGVLFLFAYHMWRIRKDGGLACVDNELYQNKKKTSENGSKKTWSLLGITDGTSVHVETTFPTEKETIRSSPDLLRRLVVVFLLTMIVIYAMSIFVTAPLEEPANPLVTPNPAKAPWYFLWLQELVADTTFHIGSYTVNGAFLGGILIPGFLLLLAALWPYIDKSSMASIGVWFHKERLRQNIVFLIILLFIFILTFVGVFMRGPSWEIYMPWEHWEVIPVRF